MKKRNCETEEILFRAHEDLIESLQSIETHEERMQFLNDYDRAVSGIKDALVMGYGSGWKAKSEEVARVEATNS